MGRKRNHDFEKGNCENEIMARQEFNPAMFDEWLWGMADDYMESLYGPDDEEENENEDEGEDEEG